MTWFCPIVHRLVFPALHPTLLRLCPHRKLEAMKESRTGFSVGALADVVVVVVVVVVVMEFLESHRDESTITLRWRKVACFLHTFMAEW